MMETTTAAMTTMTRARGSVLVVDDRENVLALMQRVLGEAHDVTTTSDPVRAKTLLARGCFDVLLTDVRMPQASGFELLAAARRCAAPPRVVMMTGFACVADAVTAMRQGAFDYLPKPLEAEEIALVVARALEGEGDRHLGAAAARAHDDAPAGPAATPDPRCADVPCDAVASEFHDAVAAARDAASRGYLVALMKQFHGNVTQAATRAGITRESLHRLLRKYDVHSDAFKATAR
jgi:DNA-binding NtrC family response regulator